MTSIVRIKRRPSQEPAEALLLAAKRLKVEESDSSNVPVVENVFRFCGTIENEKENVENIAKLVEKGKMMSHNIRHKSLKAYRNSAQQEKHVNSLASNSEKKYKVLNNLRNLDVLDNKFKVYDLVLEKEDHLKSGTVTCNGIPLMVEKNEIAQVEEPSEKYVYDLYFSDIKGAIDDSYIDSLMSVQSYPFYPHHENLEDSDIDNDDEDSNDENYWRNDYPDTEEEDEGEYDQIVGKMSGMYLEGTHELSSDDEDFIYSKDDDDAYSKYKRRVAKDLTEGNSESEEDSEDDELYMTYMMNGL